MNKEICWAPERATRAKQAEAAELRAKIEAHIAAGGSYTKVPAGVSGNDNRSAQSAEYKRLADKKNPRGKPSKRQRQDLSNMMRMGK